MNLTIEMEREKDYKEVENLIKNAYAEIYEEHTIEHIIAKNFRKSKDFVRDLDLIAKTEDNKIVASVMFARGYVKNFEGKKFEVLFLGTVCVDPDYQNKGIGKLLVEYAIEKAKTMGFSGILTFAEEEYSRKFNFKNADCYQIMLSDGGSLENFMALELYDGSFEKIYGNFSLDKAYKTNKRPLNIYNAKLC